MFKIAYHPCFSHPLPAGHRFPMEKYEWLPQQLLWEGLADESYFFEPQIPSPALPLEVHQTEYVRQVLQLDKIHARKIGFPLSKKLIDRELRIAQGTLEGALFALQMGIAFNIAGGTHHAGSCWGEGFCIFNDQAIAAQYLLKNTSINQIAIIDLDVHQGNGTAEIFRNEKQVFTFSIHGEKNFPFKKEPSNLDVALPDGTTDTVYLEILKYHLTYIFEQVKPEFIFYQAGVDVLEIDVLGKLSLSMAGCKMRDELVISACKKRGIPLQISMGGGYAASVKNIVQAHVHTFKIAKELYI